MVEVGQPPVFPFKMTAGWRAHTCNLRSFWTWVQSEGTAASSRRQKHYYDFIRLCDQLLHRQL